MGRTPKKTAAKPITISGPLETHPAVVPADDDFHTVNVPVTVSSGEPVTDPCRHCGISTVVQIGDRRVCTYPPCGKDQ